MTFYKKTSQYNYIHNWIKDWVQTFDVEIIDNGLNTVDDPSKLYSYQNLNGSSLKGYVVPRRGFPPSAADAAEGDLDINARLKNKYHIMMMILSKI